MPRLIDATKWEAFYKKMTDGLKPYDHYDDGYRDAMDNVDDWMNGNQVEAEPVRHGRWEKRGQEIYCSECGEESGYTWEGASRYSDYCPNCGAKMDGDSHD